MTETLFFVKKVQFCQWATLTLGLIPIESIESIWPDVVFGQQTHFHFHFVEFEDSGIDLKIFNLFIRSKLDIF